MCSPTERRVYAVTGSRTGIGRYLAEHYLREGVRVVGCSRGECDLQNEAYRHVPVDVSQEAQVKRLFAEIRRLHGRLDVLINNAGVLVTAPALLTTGQTMEKTLATNFLGTALCCREAAVLMKKGGFGRIVNLSSVAVPLASVGSSIYAASKAAVEQFTRTFAKEVGPFGITVNALGLPPVDQTGMADALPESAVAEALRRIALGRMVTLEEVAHAVQFFVAERSRAVTGQIVYLGGP